MGRTGIGRDGSRYCRRRLGRQEKPLYLEEAHFRLAWFELSWIGSAWIIPPSEALGVCPSSDV